MSGTNVLGQMRYLTGEPLMMNVRAVQGIGAFCTNVKCRPQIKHSEALGNRLTPQMLFYCCKVMAQENTQY
ncbi:unnamed protein product [Toxocara canis]|uniref:DNA-directed RNA polymerase n=1 Tax=Toxocara canis TaxID=6265 RepID=A0A183UJ80_TOXCA|nr:unnamed protein product [Toxocara canis]